MTRKFQRGVDARGEVVGPTMRGCLRIQAKTCGVQDLVRGFADGHLCECSELVTEGIPLLDGRPEPINLHGRMHRCGECGRTFSLEQPVSLEGLPIP